MCFGGAFGFMDFGLPLLLYLWYLLYFIVLGILLVLYLVYLLSVCLFLSCLWFISFHLYLMLTVSTSSLKLCYLSVPLFYIFQNQFSLLIPEPWTK